MGSLSQGKILCLVLQFLKILLSNSIWPKFHFIAWAPNGASGLHSSLEDNTASLADYLAWKIWRNRTRSIDSFPWHSRPGRSGKTFQFRGEFCDHLPEPRSPSAFHYRSLRTRWAWPFLRILVGSWETIIECQANSQVSPSLTRGRPLRETWNLGEKTEDGKVAIYFLLWSLTNCNSFNTPVRRAGFSRKAYHHSGIQHLHITGTSLVDNQTITGDLQWLEQFWLWIMHFWSWLQCNWCDHRSISDRRFWDDDSDLTWKWAV